MRAAGLRNALFVCQTALMQRKSRLNAFTLVEILVVLAVVVVLAAILFPVFNRVREQGRATTCRSNLKQLATAVQLYAQDNNGRIPFLFDENILASYLGNVANAKNMFFCPSQTQPDNVWSYNQNEDVADFSIALNIGKPQDRILKPSQTWLQTDGVDYPSGDGPHSAFIKPAQGSPCLFSTWHSGGANYSFVDGHVKWMLPEPACTLWNESRSN